MNILITGAISLSNKGTAAIIISTINNLKKILPNSQIQIELFYPEKQKEIMDIEECCGVHIVTPLIQSKLKAIFIFLLIALTFPFRKIGIKLPVNKELKNYENADVILDISAEAFVKYYDDDLIQMSVRFLAHLYPLLLGILLEKHIILLAQTLAPFGLFKPLMKYVLKKTILITTRDIISIENLRKEGVKSDKIYSCADPAFLLEAASDERIDEILKSERIDIENFRTKGQKLLGLCVAKTTGRVLKTEEYEKLIKTLSKTAETLIKERNIIVIFIPHSSGKIKKESNDVIVGLNIANNIKDKENFYVIKGDYTPQELKGIIGKLDCMLSLRMHPIISALSLGVPSVIIAFNDKAYGLMKMFELEDNVIHINEIEKNVLIELVNRCLNEDQLMRKIIKSKIPEIGKKALINFKLLEQILDEK